MPVIASDADSPEKQVDDALNVDVAKGWTSDQVKEKQKQYGRNEVAEKQPNPVLAFAKKFWGLTAWMLEVAIVLSFVLGKYLDLYIITALLLVNAILGFIQERASYTSSWSPQAETTAKGACLTGWTVADIKCC